MPYNYRLPDDYKPAPQPRAHTVKCPICAQGVRYIGLTDVECWGEFALENHTQHCPNFFGAVVHPPLPAVGSQAWARLVASLYRGTKFRYVYTSKYTGLVTSYESDPWSFSSSDDATVWHVVP